ncbi:D-alanine--poly(phosphoribitol) ligase subunit 1 [Runella defluvii]|uniref:D-alanine--poly(Phosphoribitol) ligase subunit 1 n=1 Tax=Runella defluvii TaxID=370973 RepID=A0A7W6EST2_9BACT|nr:AMP-binding protein [Runella defluvii]MBB3841065.1 D-alanine--poly(phosphoribitol) ligase subunit 1 [Runella defluvii]
MIPDFIQMLLLRQNSQSVAVSERNRDWTYQEFVRDVQNAQAFFLQKRIEKILIALPQSYYAYVLEWAAYTAGITFCPVSITTPIDRLHYFISQFQPDLIFAEVTIRHETTQIAPQTFFKGLEKSGHLLSPKNLEIAYVIFTSGSTGTPKGVMVKRTGLDNFLRWSTTEYPVGENDVWGQYSNLSFDLSICDIFTALCKGACLVPVATPAEKLLPGNIIKNKKITFWHSVPSVVDVLSKAKQLKPETLSSLKTITFCGEKLFPSQLELLFEANPNLLIYNTYGPTEGTVFFTFIKLTKENYKDFANNTISIGNPIEGYRLHLQPYNEDNSLGEIIILSDYLAKGYLNNPENKAFGTIQNESKRYSAYFTGDYAEQINENLYFVCRKDAQIKVMGHRVDLSEIDHELRNFGCHASISTFYRNKIISFVVVDNFNEAQIMAYLTQKLPPYYIPNLVIAKEQFSYNNSSKIDLKQLIQSIEYLFET